MNVAELVVMEITTTVRRSGEKPMPCTSSCSRYSGLRVPGVGRLGVAAIGGWPSRITPSNLLSAGSITDTAPEN
jgi:hypothetical protein